MGRTEDAIEVQVRVRARPGGTASPTSTRREASSVTSRQNMPTHLKSGTQVVGASVVVVGPDVVVGAAVVVGASVVVVGASVVVVGASVVVVGASVVVVGASVVVVGASVVVVDGGVKFRISRGAVGTPASREATSFLVVAVVVTTTAYSTLLVTYPAKGMARSVPDTMPVCVPKIVGLSAGWLFQVKVPAFQVVGSLGRASRTADGAFSR